MNPPDHTRLSKLALPAFSPRAVAVYAGKVDREELPCSSPGP
jgi:cytochrome P450